MTSAISIAATLVVAIAAAATALAAAPTPPAALSPADLAFKAGEFEHARALYAADVQRTPTDTHALGRLGVLDLYADRHAQAEAEFRQTLALAPDDGPAKRGLATLHARDLAGDTAHARPLAAPVIVPFVALDPLPVIKVRLNGTREATFLIDTGAPTVALDPALAAELGAVAKDAGSGVFAGGRQAPIQTTELASVAIGGAVLDHVPATILPMGAGQIVTGVRVEGIIGTGFFYRYLATLDYAHSRLILAPRSDSVAFEAAARARGAAITPMWLVGDHFLFARARINDRLEGLFSIDTGGAGAGVQLASGVVAAAGVTLDTAHTQTGIGGGGPVELIPISAEVRIDTLDRKDVHGFVTPGGDQYGIFPFAVAGTVTHQFFLGHALTFDFEAMEMVID
jgi:hypothetical protein